MAAPPAGSRTGKYSLKPPVIVPPAQVGREETMRLMSPVAAAGEFSSTLANSPGLPPIAFFFLEPSWACPISICANVL